MPSCPPRVKLLFELRFTQTHNPILYENAVVQVNGGGVQNHVHVNGTGCLPTIKDVVANCNVNQSPRLFLFFKITIASAGGIKTNAKFGYVVGVGYRLNHKKGTFPAACCEGVTQNPSRRAKFRNTP